MNQLSRNYAPVSDKSGKNGRSNEQWLSALRMSREVDAAAQQTAIADLSRYMFVVAYNALMKKRSQYSKLSTMDSSTIKALAQDFAQDVMVKLARREFELLDQFAGRGNFTSWVAMIVSNEIASEFRKVRWQRVQPLTEMHKEAIAGDNGTSPESVAANNSLREAIEDAILTLSPKLRTALIRCVLNEEKATDVATDLGVTTNAVYSAIHRAKRALQVELADYQLP